jgi:hypothetical protein
MDDVLFAALEDPGKLDLKPSPAPAEDPNASAKKKGRARDRVAGTPSSAP